MLIVSYANPKYLLIYSCITPASPRLHPKHWLFGFATCYLNALLWQPQIRAIAWLLCYRGRSQVWSAWQGMSSRRTNKALPWRRRVTFRKTDPFLEKSASKRPVIWVFAIFTFANLNKQSRCQWLETLWRSWDVTVTEVLHPLHQLSIRALKPPVW